MTEEYDGTNWTAGGAPLISMSFGGTSLNSSVPTFSSFGTNSTPVGFHQWYDGTSFSTAPNLATPRSGAGGAGSSNTASIVFGGRAPAFSTATEEFTGETTTLNVKTLTTS